MVCEPISQNSNLPNPSQSEDAVLAWSNNLSACSSSSIAR